MTTDEPSHQRCISTDEVDFIIRNRSEQTKSLVAPPYLQILLTPAVWVVILAEFANSWGLFMILTEGPNFISEVLDRDIKEVRKCLKVSINVDP